MKKLLLLILLLSSAGLIAQSYTFNTNQNTGMYSSYYFAKEGKEIASFNKNLTVLNLEPSNLLICFDNDPCISAKDLKQRLSNVAIKEK